MVIIRKIIFFTKFFIQINHYKQNCSMGNCTDIDNVAPPKESSQTLDKNQNITQHTEASIQHLKKDLLNIKQDSHCLNKEIIQFLFEEIEDYHLTSTEQNQFLHLLQKYLQIFQESHIDSKKSQLKNKVISFSEATLRSINEIHFNHLQTIKILQKIFHSTCQNGRINLNSLTYNLQDKNQVLLVAKTIKKCCYEDLNAFYFLTAYLVQCCKKMASSQKYQIAQIENQLKETLNMLKKQHPPNEKKINGNTQFKIDETKELEHSLKLQMKTIQPQQRNQKLQQLILEVADQANNKKYDLIKLTKWICLSQKGTGYKAGVKASKNAPKSSIDRIKQKLFSKAFQKCEIPNNQKNLDKFLQFQRVKYHQQISVIFNKMNQDLIFNVTDMVRGKCMHPEIDNIKIAAQQIISQAKRLGYSVQVDNRLHQKTTDLVLKIKIKDIIAQFQLAYKFNVVQNQFNHKLYELSRSKFFSTLSTLFIFHQKSYEFINELYFRMKKLQKKQTQIRIKREGQKLESAAEILSRFEKFLIQKSYKLENIQESSVKNKSINLKNRIAKLMDSSKILNNQQQIFNREYFSSIFWDKYHKKDKALAIYNKLIDKISKNSNSQTISQQKYQLIKEVAKIFKGKGKYSQAQEYYKNCLKYEEETYGKENSNVATTLNNLGNIQRQKGNYKKALQYFQKSLYIEQKNKGKDHIDCANIINSIGILYRHEGKYPLALKYLHQCLQIEKKVLGNEHINLASTYNNIGMVYKYQKKYQEALNNYQHCLKIQENVRGKDHIDTATTLNNIGLVKKCQQKYEEALYYYQRTLDIQQRVKGKGDIACASTLNNIGVVYRRLKRYEQALVYYQRCLEIQQSVKGIDCIDSASTLNNIGMAYKYLGKYQQAYQKIKQCLRIESKIKGKQSIDCAQTLENLGLICKEMNKISEAQEFYQRGLQIYEKILGKDSSQAKQVREKLQNLN